MVKKVCEYFSHIYATAKHGSRNLVPEHAASLARIYPFRRRQAAKGSFRKWEVFASYIAGKWSCQLRTSRSPKGGVMRAEMTLQRSKNGWRGFVGVSSPKNNIHWQKYVAFIKSISHSGLSHSYEYYLFIETFQATNADNMRCSLPSLPSPLSEFMCWALEKAAGERNGDGDGKEVRGCEKSPLREIKLRQKVSIVSVRKEERKRSIWRRRNIDSCPKFFTRSVLEVRTT